MNGEDDRRFMRRALELAGRGAGFVNPNPMVGAVLVKNGRIIGEGWHKAFGGPHAEVHALRAAGGEAAGATLYVTLEPCAHTGKTPPCADAVAAAGVARCVAAMRDPFPAVAGRGFERLRQAGIAVECGLFEREARALNQPFLKRAAGGSPYLFLKAAVTLDGKLATRTGQSQWISNEAARKRVHRLRGTFAAVAVGAATAAADDPRLDCRLKSGFGGGDAPGDDDHQPARIVIDGALSLPERLRFVQNAGDGRSFLLTTAEAAAADPQKVRRLEAAGVRITVAGADRAAGVPFRLPAAALGEAAAAWGFDSVMVEGGGGIFSWLAAADAFDAGEIFVAPKLLGDRNAVPFLDGFAPAAVADGWQLPNAEPVVYDGQVSYRFYKRMW